MSNLEVSFKGYQNYYTLIKFPAEFTFLLRFSFGHVTKQEISKITNKSKMKKVENSLNFFHNFKNHYFWSFGQKWLFGLLTVAMRKLVIKNCRLQKLKSDTYTKK